MMELFEYVMIGFIAAAAFMVLGAIIFVITWLCFMIIMWGKNHWGEVYTYPAVPLLLVSGIVGWLLDVIWNIIYATLIFQQLPDFHKGMSLNDVTLSHRLRQILRNDTSIREGMVRWKIADSICKYFIEPHDKCHCGRNE